MRSRRSCSSFMVGMTILLAPPLAQLKRGITTRLARATLRAIERPAHVRFNQLAFLVCFVEEAHDVLECALDAQLGEGKLLGRNDRGDDAAQSIGSPTDRRD